MQRRITAPGPLHDESGRLVETGYATGLIKTYDRSRIAARPWRIKEWDYYAVCTDRFALALTIDHNGYMVMDSISLLDFETNSQVTCSRMNLPAFAKRSLPATSEKGNIRVNERMETTSPGLYAAGDCTGGLLQVAKAVYEGAVAGLEVVKYVRNREAKA